MRKTVIVGDLGGTHARFAQHVPDDNGLNNLNITSKKTFKTKNYPSVTEAVTDYVSKSNLALSNICGLSLAIAAPINARKICFPNSHWEIDALEIEAALNIGRVKLTNDFVAVAMSLPYALPESITNLRSFFRSCDGAKVVLGPGTGLGVAGLIPSNRCGSVLWVPLASEAGHISFAPQNEFESTLWSVLAKKYQRVSVERVLSGSGLEEIFSHWTSSLYRGTLEQLSAEEIIEKARDGDSDCLVSLGLFLDLVGSFAGDCALMYGATGGVYLSGGILPRINSVLNVDRALSRFDQKGRLSTWAADIPVFLVNNDDAGLRGAAVAWGLSALDLLNE